MMTIHLSALASLCETEHCPGKTHQDPKMILFEEDIPAPIPGRKIFQLKSDSMDIGAYEYVPYTVKF